jgi:imidazolonepropionase
VFVEDTAFSVAQARRIFAAAAQHGMRAKLHADQLTDTAGAALAAEVGAVSADHLECASPEGLAAMASAGVVGVTLPIASLYTFQTPWDASAALDAGVQVAVSTDFNPGSAPSANMHLAMMLACTLNRMTPEAVLQGVTRVAARAVGREAHIGQLAPGFAADLAVFDVPSVDHMLYQFQGRPAHATIKSGALVWGQLSA